MLNHLPHPQPLTTEDMLTSLDPDLLRCVDRLLTARRQMDPAAFLAALEALTAAAEDVHRAMTGETYAPAADAQSSLVLARETPGVPDPDLVMRLEVDCLLPIYHEDPADNG